MAEITFQNNFWSNSKLKWDANFDLELRVESWFGERGQQSLSQIQIRKIPY